MILITLNYTSFAPTPFILADWNKNVNIVCGAPIRMLYHCLKMIAQPFGFVLRVFNNFKMSNSGPAVIGLLAVKMTLPNVYILSVTFCFFFLCFWFHNGKANKKNNKKCVMSC